MRLLHVGLRHGRRGARDSDPARPVGRDEIIEALSGHVCRCTGYAKILDAVAAASRGEGSVVNEPAFASTGGEPEGGAPTKGAPA